MRLQDERKSKSEGSQMSNRNMVDKFIDEAVGEELVNTANNQDLSEAETREIQAGLNLLAAAFPQDNAEDLIIDGVFGPKTHVRLKEFVAGLPEETQERVRTMLDPIVNVG